MSWIFLTSAGGIIGFDADAFNVITGGLNSWTGTWSVTQIVDSLQVNYVVIPEMGTLFLFGLCGSLAWLLHLKKRSGIEAPKVRTHTSASRRVRGFHKRGAVE